MKKKHFLFIAVAVIVAGLVFANIKARKERALPVQAEAVAVRDIEMVVSASGNIRPKRKVDISASSIGKVTRVAVREGDRVEKGQFLIQIDPVELESTVERLEASLRASLANQKQVAAQAEQARVEYDRAKALFERGFRTSQEVESAKVNMEVAIARLEAIEHEISQIRSSIQAAKHSLKEVTITAPMAGIVTKRNVEEGEIAIMGTLNNPGTVLLTIADLSTIEAEVEVDETEVTDISIGDPAIVKLDAFPDTSFKAVVTEIGNSPISSLGSSSQRGVDFKVILTIEGTVPNVRPGLTGSAEITVARVRGVPSIPIQSLTARRKRDLKSHSPGGHDTTLARRDDSSAADEEKELEGVFVVKDGRAHFRPVKVGISSQKYFEVKSGLSPGEMVVTGNFKAIRELRDGQRVKVTAKEEKKEKK